MNKETEHICFHSENNLLSQKLQHMTSKETHLKQTWLECCWDDPLENLPIFLPILLNNPQHSFLVHLDQRSR